MKLVNVLFLVVLMGCAGQTEREIKHDKKKVGEIRSREVMIVKVRMILEDSPNLSEDQKDKFFVLHGEVMGKVEDKASEIRKLKIVMFQEMASTEVDEHKTRAISKKIRKLYSDRLDIMFDAMGDARKILGIKTIQALGKRWMDKHFSH